MGFLLSAKKFNNCQKLEVMTSGFQCVLKIRRNPFKIQNMSNVKYFMSQMPVSVV